jgi:hypothetical protein
MIMSVRPEVRRFVDHGPLPSEDEATEEEVTARHSELAAIAKPVSAEEAAELLKGFGPDDAFGVAWTLLHLIETAPSSPVRTQPAIEANEWVRLLWHRGAGAAS